MPLIFDVAIESWPLAQPFVISRGTKTEAKVVVVRIGDGVHTGRGECVPYARYGETPEATADTIRAYAADVRLHALTLPEMRRDALAHIPPGAARNAMDCALWDLEAKASGQTVASLVGLGDNPAKPILTAYTISLDTPDSMAAKAAAVAHLPLLKLKLGGAGDDARLRAVRAARPTARLIADANEAWTGELLQPLMAVAFETGIEMIEQPLPAGDDDPLAVVSRAVPVCADEAFHTRADLPRLVGRYDAVNIKLDKTGGLTEALAVMVEARAAGLEVMVGSMVSTSLAVAPALLLAQHARWVDLDGPLLLARDRPDGLIIQDGMIYPAQGTLWGA